MPLIPLSYCNASLGKTASFSYNDTTHTVGSGSLGASCSPGLLAGEELYSHTDGGILYRVIVKNTSPYAQVVAVTPPSCSIEIESVDVTDSATDTSNNGVITINATGNGVKSYSLDGFTWQSSNVFTGVAPGEYAPRVRNLFSGSYCYYTELCQVGYTALSSCDLTLGNVATTPGPGGTLTVLDYDTIHTDQPVEYRLDAGAWQDSSAFTGLASGTYSVQVRFKNFTGCNDSRNVTLSACDVELQLIDITHEQTRYGDDGLITITATSSAVPIQYSIDDGATYQSGNVFEGVAPGIYQVRVKDDDDCEAFSTIEVLRYKKAVVVFPIANAHRLVITDGPVADTGPQNFDNTLFEEMYFPGREKTCFKQPFKGDDLVPLQWRSSYATHSLKIYNGADVLQQTVTPTKRTALMGFSEELNANFSNYGGGQTQIWFPTGLPTWIEIGMDVTIAGQPSLNGTYEIEDIVPGTGEAEGYQVLIVSQNYSESTDPLTGTITIVYDIEDYEVWEAIIDNGLLTTGKYYLIIEGTDNQFDDFIATSEPFEATADLDDVVLLRYRNFENAYLIDYSTGIEHLLRVEAELVPVAPGGEREMMEDSNRRLDILRGNVTRQVQLNVFDIPSWLVEKISVALIHDLFTINGIAYRATDDVDSDMPDPIDMLCNMSVKLRQVEFIAENSDDDGDVDGTALQLDSGTIMALEP